MLVGRSACQPSAYVCVFFLCQVTVHRWMGALNAHTFCFHEFCVCHKHVCAFTQSVCVCVCVCVCGGTEALCQQWCALSEPVSNYSLGFQRFSPSISLFKPD